MTEKIKLFIQDTDGNTRHESYSAVIGIELTPSGVIKLHIRENGDLSEEWWRRFPVLLQSTIDAGIESRKAQRRVTDARNEKPSA